MKITRKNLEHFIKEELEEVMSVAHPVLEDALEQVLPVIEKAYASLPDDETKAEFEEYLLTNVQEYAEKWRAERKGLPDKSDQFVYSPSRERIDISGGDFPASGESSPGNPPRDW